MTPQSAQRNYIEAVLINGRELGLVGYLDIGLIDIMKDMLLESLGALVYVPIYYLTVGKRQAFRPKLSLIENEEQLEVEAHIRLP